MRWYCKPCGEYHEFGDICWYWDVDPEPEDKCDMSRDMENYFDFLEDS